MQKRALLKLIALLIIFIFTFPCLNWAFETNTYSNSILKTSSLQYHGKSVQIPAHLGTIQKIFRGNQSKIVIHIQDLHCNYEVQKNIFSIIQFLSKEHGLKMVGEEGAFERVKVDQIRKFPMDNLRATVSDYFVRGGKLTGQEFYACTGAQNIILEGLETPELYDASEQTARGFLNSESQGYYLDLRDSLESVKTRLPQRRQSELADWIKRLDIIEKMLNVSATRWEVDEFRQHRDKFSTRAFREYIGMQENPAEPGNGLEDLDLDPYLQQADEFYRLADQRSRDFARNLVRKMDQHQEDLAVMVTGGYHTEDIVTELQNQGISCLSIVPTFTGAGAANPYFALFQKQLAHCGTLAPRPDNMALRTWPGTGDFSAEISKTLGIMGHFFMGRQPGRLRIWQDYFNQFPLREIDQVSGSELAARNINLPFGCLVYTSNFSGQPGLFLLAPNISALPRASWKRFRVFDNIGLAEFNGANWPALGQLAALLQTGPTGLAGLWRRLNFSITPAIERLLGPGKKTDWPGNIAFTGGQSLFQKACFAGADWLGRLAVLLGRPRAILASDIDGTLTEVQKLPLANPYTKALIYELKKNGYPMIPVTGKGVKYIRNFMGLNGLPDAGAIAELGAVFTRSPGWFDNLREEIYQTAGHILGTNRAFLKAIRPEKKKEFLDPDNLQLATIRELLRLKKPLADDPFYDPTFIEMDGYGRLPVVLESKDNMITMFVDSATETLPEGIRKLDFKTPADVPVPADKNITEFVGEYIQGKIDRNNLGDKLGTLIYSHQGHLDIIVRGRKGERIDKSIFTKDIDSMFGKKSLLWVLHDLLLWLAAGDYSRWNREARAIISKRQIEIAYFGDDINDLPAIELPQVWAVTSKQCKPAVVKAVGQKGMRGILADAPLAAGDGWIVAVLDLALRTEFFGFGRDAVMQQVSTQALGIGPSQLRILPAARNLFRTFLSALGSDRAFSILQQTAPLLPDSVRAGQELALGKDLGLRWNSYFQKYEIYPLTAALPDSQANDIRLLPPGAGRDIAFKDRTWKFQLGLLPLLSGKLLISSIKWFTDGYASFTEKYSAIFMSLGFPKYLLPVAALSAIILLVMRMANPPERERQGTGHPRRNFQITYRGCA